MKIHCDVCNKTEASVYCSADEAALCSSCDHRVHHANKLAGKHPRFSLLHPSPQNSPLCDICQHKKAFIFCQQDRAILCQDCDSGIHKVNQHSRDHNRFLLTGVKLSPPALTQNGVVVHDQKKRKPAPSSQIVSVQTSVETTNCHQQLNGSGHRSDTSSISEYLIETLPGWHVDDFLDPPSNTSKIGDNDPGSIWGGNLTGSLNSSFSPESMGIWVPQAPALTSQFGHAAQQFEPGSNLGFGDQIVNGSSLAFGQNDCNYVNKITHGVKSSRNWVSDIGNCFMVPQISPSSTTNKRSRTLWE